eukprot:3420226-Rhodomonas_salina.1
MPVPKGTILSLKSVCGSLHTMLLCPRKQHQILCVLYTDSTQQYTASLVLPLFKGKSWTVSEADGKLNPFHLPVRMDNTHKRHVRI